MAVINSSTLGKHNTSFTGLNAQLDDADAVADMAALTAPADIATTYTEAEVQAIRDDVAAARTTINALLASLRTAGLLAS